MKKLKVLDLFSGIGGFSLAGHKHGFETVAFCEYDKEATKVLNKRWPDIPVYPDVRALTKEDLENDGIGSIDVICGGFPCQPFSVAGKQRGQDDSRHLWPEMFRLIKELRPGWVIGENVPGLINLGLDEVCADLESEGYAVQTYNISAICKDARHKRERLWIVAYADKSK